MKRQQRRLAEEQEQDDEGVRRGEEQVVGPRDQGGHPDHLDRREGRHERVAEQRRPAEQQSAQALPAHRRGLGRRCVGGAEEVEFREDLDQVGDVHALAVRGPVALGRLARGEAVGQHPDQFRAVGGEDGVGVGLRAADGDFVGLLQVDEPAQGQRSVQVEARGVGVAVHRGVHGASLREVGGRRERAGGADERRELMGGGGERCRS